MAKAMPSLRDFLSGDPLQLHIEELLFTETVRHSGGTQQHCYLGAASARRFLIIELVSAEAAARPLEPTDCRWIYGRSGTWDFVRTGDLPIIRARPRTQREPEMERSFQMMESVLRGGLNLGMGLAKPGSFRWEGDAFVAEYAQLAQPAKQSVRILTPDGKEAPEAVKEAVLADLQTQYETGERKFIFSHSEQRISHGTNPETAAAANEPNPGSVEARMLALWADREKERLRKGIHGKLVRDEDGRVVEIVAECEPSFRVRLYYEPSSERPDFMPHRIETFIKSAEARPGIPDREVIIHGLRIAERALDDTAFDPWPHLNPRSFARGVWQPDGTTIVPDPDGRKLVHEFLKARQRGGGAAPP